MIHPDLASWVDNGDHVWLLVGKQSSTVFASVREVDSVFEIRTGPIHGERYWPIIQYVSSLRFAKRLAEESALKIWFPNAVVKTGVAP